MRSAWNVRLFKLLRARRWLHQIEAAIEHHHLLALGLQVLEALVHPASAAIRHHLRSQSEKAPWVDTSVDCPVSTTQAGAYLIVAEHWLNLDLVIELCRITRCGLG